MGGKGNVLRSNQLSFYFNGKRVLMLSTLGIPFFRLLFFLADAPHSTATSRIRDTRQLSMGLLIRRSAAAVHAPIATLPSEELRLVFLWGGRLLGAGQEAGNISTICSLGSVAFNHC